MHTFLESEEVPHLSFELEYQGSSGDPLGL
jgi:hypothetical protein